MHRVVIVSGGMDSVTLAYLIHRETPDASMHILSFNYGQRHNKELWYASKCARELHADHNVIDISHIRDFLAQSHSVLVDPDTDVPEGHYAAESMRITVVPNRNAIMLSIATGVAVAEGASDVSIGVHAGDHYIYPDCRPAFIDAINIAFGFGNEGFAVEDFHVYAPFIRMSKADIARVGAELDVDFTDTWSCYKGDLYHCGKCGTCVERHEALEEALGDDPTTYEGHLQVREVVNVPNNEML